MPSKPAARPAPSKRFKEVEKLLALLRPFERPQISTDARDAYVRRRTIERARACFDPDGRHALDDEWLVLFYVMLEDVSARCRQVFRLFFIEELEISAIATQLGITVRTAKLDFARALAAFSREQREVEREGVDAKRK